MSRYRSAFAVLLAAFVTGCGGSSTPTAVDPGGSDPAVQVYAASLNVNLATMTRLTKYLYIQDLVAGTGTAASNSHLLWVTYTGWLPNGTQFDTDVGKAASFSFYLGTGNVIAGWDQGLVGLHVGGKRRLVIGSSLGYGTTARGIIPSNSTLVFDVQLDSLK